MIRARELTKRYGSTLALDRLTLDLPEGAVLGLLGPNGAGKTTYLRMVMGFVFPDGGSLERRGVHPSRIGYLPERAFYPSRLSIEQYLRTVGRLSGLGGAGLERSVSGLIEDLGLGTFAGRRLGACSRGMLQRVGVAQSLVGDPPVVLLDEPLIGLDPSGQKLVRHVIGRLHSRGRTVLLASHNLGEVARVCTHIALLRRGRLVRSGPLDEFIASRAEVVIATGAMQEELVARLRGLGDGVQATERMVVLMGSSVALKPAVLRLLLDAGVDVSELREQRTTLEESYLAGVAG